MKKITTPEMETCLAYYFGIRTNLVVPNVSWGFLPHEADLIVMSKAGYLTEVEIKISLSDLKADSKKNHCHESKKIGYLYFAIPEYLLEKGEQFIPERAGILVIKEVNNRRYRGVAATPHRVVHPHRQAVENKPRYKLTDKEQFQIARLGALRIWGLKSKVIGYKKRLEEK